jgi:virginiamycin B lyase
VVLSASRALSIRTAKRAGLLAGAIALAACSAETENIAAADGTLLFGRITGANGEPLAGVPIRAKRDGGTIAVVVYSDSEGNYSFPEWSDLTAGTHTVSITLPEFEQARVEGTALAEGAPTELDFALTARTPTVEDASASEIIAALPGTDHGKVLFSQCSNCHSLQRALRFEYSQEEWAEIIKLMAGTRNSTRTFPGSMTFGQQRFIEPLSAYLASLRGPGSTGEIPFEMRPRPTSDEASRMVITEYDVPRGGEFDLHMLRGDERFVWPHDVIVDDKYAWYTDHFSYILGRLDKETGEVVELDYPLPPGGGRIEGAPGEMRAGNPGGGSPDMLFDSNGDIIIGMDSGTVRYFTETGQSEYWTTGNNMFGLAPNDHVWHTDDGGPLYQINTLTGETILHDIPTNDGVYDMDTDSQGRTIINIWRNAKIGVFDPATNAYSEYPLLTPESGPRRGEIDAQDRLWTTLYYAGRIARFDPDTGEVKEFAVIPGTETYEAPYAAPYSLSVDNESGFLWTSDFNSTRLYRMDMEIGDSIEYMLPGPYEMRDLTVEPSTERPTLWIPSYRPPSQIVKVQLR